jgi:hypothetical protein
MYLKRRDTIYTLEGERVHLWDIVNLQKHIRIYIPGQRNIEISRDVTFEEDIAFQRSKESHMEIDSETITSPPSKV